MAINKIDRVIQCPLEKNLYIVFWKNNPYEHIDIYSKTNELAEIQDDNKNQLKNKIVILVKDKNIKKYPSIERTGDLLKYLFYRGAFQCTGVILERKNKEKFANLWNKPWEELEKKLKENIEKYNLKECIRITNETISSNLDLLTKFKFYNPQTKQNEE